MRDWIDENSGILCIATGVASVVLVIAMIVIDIKQDRDAAKACRIAGGTIVRLNDGAVCAKVEVIEVQHE